ncbi:TPA: O-antigen ligase C-terminal domain-containing protein [Acinetobacter baumannii]|uniref:PglL family O-oligosaccharyltransferase n=1 Tax=Acinetobacter baumannii TaxID=470 RepID=UPI00244D767A|nr:O-antigen ligase family protein [Acinetobacter baumannii]MDH2603077.1 Wzy polymerase domain-containing protein [Acinetobacter baumannii]HEN9521962.1 O-antigen ligase C-terminal domain-containing protein [Acinetobacter baumannii]HEN9529833.1 O-antigen ligase C-terminal domain-containing protein [Acinetobacter baumannii]HEN9565107.1 O-antigen ligase C-terminal domain-containing protein [Acinetobacter baumannii]HEO0814539.1 O-antigen ligase C-terminal domain-containing protein [Acinetobacter b
MLVRYIFIFSAFLMSAAWLIPNHYMPWLAAHSDFLAFLVLLILSIVFIKQKQIIFLPLPFIYLSLIAFIPILQFLAGKIFFFGDALITVVYILGFVLALLYGFLLGGENKEIYKWFFFLILINSLICIYIEMNQWLLLSNGSIWVVDLSQSSRPYANFSQPNTCATFLSMGLMSTLYIYEKKYINKIGLIVIGTFILFGVALTQSRTSWVFISLFIIWWFWKNNYLKTRLNKWLIFYFLIVYMFYILILPKISKSLGVIGTADIITRTTTGYLRITMWKQMLIAIKEQPLFGYGWNQVSVAQLSVFLKYPTQEWIEHSHNIVLDIFIWNGIPLGILIIGFIGWWLYQLSKLAISIEAFAALSMVGAVLVHAMLEFPLEYAFFLLPVGFLLGLVQSENNYTKTISVNNKLFSIFIVSAFSLYIWIFLEYKAIEKDVQLARFESLNIGNIHANQSAPKILLLSQLRNQLKFIRTPPVANMSKDELNWMKSVSYRYATPTALYRYAQALALNKQLHEAKKHLLIIEKLHHKKFSTESLYQVNDSLIFGWKNTGK